MLQARPMRGDMSKSSSQEELLKYSHQHFAAISENLQAKTKKRHAAELRICHHVVHAVPGDKM